MVYLFDHSIHDLVKTLFMSQCFQQKNVNTFDVLIFIQVHKDENKFLQIRRR